jgi:adenylate cyclase
MTIELKSEPNFQLGTLAVSPSACQVTGAHGVRAVQPKVMQVLVALAQADGAVVTREWLEARIWNGVVVGEDAITRAIGHLRRVSEWGGDRSFQIRTVPKIGFVLTRGSGQTDASVEPLLAVLPFDNLSDDPALAFASDAISEEILQTIAKGTSLAVIGRSSSFQFRGERKTTRTIAQELRATHILDGAVRRAGQRIRVTAHLTEVAGQTVIWSDRFEYDNAEIFELQDRIGEHVAAALDRTFARSRRPAGVDPAAYDLYLRGAECARNIVPNSQRQAIALLEEATRRMPGFADAWGELALARAQANFLRFEPRTAESEQERRRAEGEAEHARGIDPQCAAARLIPYVGGPLFDFTEHRRRFEQPRPSKLATVASPDVSLGVQLLEVGRPAEALEFFRQAERLDPLFQIRVFGHAHALAAVGETAAAVDRLDAAVARWPDIPFFGATRIVWAALLDDWKTVDAFLLPEQLARSPLHLRLKEITALVDICRARDASPSALWRLRSEAFAIGKCGLEAILVHARHAGLTETMRLIDEAGERLVDTQAPRRPDDLGATSLFLPFFKDLRHDPLFSTLCGRLGLAFAQS